MNFDIPKPLQVEHEALLAMLVDATREAGAVGEAAREVARLLHPHFAMTYRAVNLAPHGSPRPAMRATESVRAISTPSRPRKWQCAVRASFCMQARSCTKSTGSTGGSDSGERDHAAGAI